MNIIEISTLYPENKNNLRKDTNALKYFVDDWVEMGNKVLVLHPYRIPIADCFKALFDCSRFSVHTIIFLLSGSSALWQENSLKQ